jgi:hypothetical protein
MVKPTKDRQGEHASYALQDRDTLYFTSLQATRAASVRSVSVGAGRSMVAPANECLSKVLFLPIAHRIE